MMSSPTVFLFTINIFFCAAQNMEKFEEQQIGVVKKFLSQNGASNTNYEQLSCSYIPEAQECMTMQSIPNRRLQQQQQSSQNQKKSTTTTTTTTDGSPTVQQKSITRTDGYDEGFVRKFETRETEAKLLIDFYMPVLPQYQDEYVRQSSPVIRAEDDILARFMVTQQSPEVTLVENTNVETVPVIKKTEDEVLSKFSSYFEVQGEIQKEFPEQVIPEPSPVLKEEDDILSKFLPPKTLQYSPKIVHTTEDEILKKFTDDKNGKDKEDVPENVEGQIYEFPVQEVIEKTLEEDQKDNTTSAAEIQVEDVPQQSQEEPEVTKVDESAFSEVDESEMQALKEKERFEKIFGRSTTRSGINIWDDINDYDTAEEENYKNHGYKRNIQLDILLLVAFFIFSLMI